MRHEPDAARRSRDGGESRVESNIGIGADDAHAVRSDKTHACIAADSDELFLKLSSLRAGFSESCGYHDKRAHFLDRALPRYIENVARGHDDYGEVHRSRNVGDRGI